MASDLQNDKEIQYRNFLSNPSMKELDQKYTVSYKETERVNRMSSNELFEMKNLMADLTPLEKKAVNMFVEEFDKLKKLRVDKEYNEAKALVQNNTNLSRKVWRYSRPIITINS